MKRVILQLFQWKLKDIIEWLPEINNCGYNYIQISPIQPTKDDGIEWWKLYQPLSFTIGNSQIGNKSELKELTREAAKYNIKIIVDVVVNHVASDEHDCLKPHRNVDKALTSRKDFWKEKRLIQNWDNRYEVINYSNGLPCLDLSNHDLQDIIIKFLDELVDCGVGGFRIDSSKSIALPEEGSDFWIRVLNSIKNKENLFNYAEVIYSSKELIDTYNKYVYVTTSCPASDNSKVISYVENHDCFLDSVIGYTHNWSDEKILYDLGYIFDNFENILYYARPFNDTWRSESMKKLIREHINN